MSISKTALLEMISIAQKQIAVREKPNSRENYAYNTLEKVVEYLKDSTVTKKKKTDDMMQYIHRGIEVIEDMIEVFGEESAYIYCIMQTYKHLYLYEYDKDKDRYTTANFYKEIADRLDKAISKGE